VPKFYYNIRDGDEWTNANGGFEMPNIEIAKNEAKRAAIDSLSDRFPASIDLTVELFDDKGNLVCTAHVVFTSEEH